MNISFIITTFNIESYIRQCLDSVSLCTKPGDQVIIVDDASTDETLSEVYRAVGSLEDVEVLVIPLGVNTVGGVGIPGNIGLAASTRDAVFFVDGDDYLEPKNFRSARERFSAGSADILITNYQEYDQAAERTKDPADAQRWLNVTVSREMEDLRMRAISMIAVPWRKFYRREFIESHSLRFPEGRFFFEDNPFHWQVCLAARSIEFFNTVICYHRVNRPGQTMASTGLELAAFFTHYKTIVSGIAPHQTAYRAQAVRWLIGNMSWHLSRLQPSAYISYVTAGAEVLQSIDESTWVECSASLKGSRTWMYANSLREHKLFEVVEALRGQRRDSTIETLQREISAMRQKLDRTEQHAKTGLAIVRAQQALTEFQAIKALGNRD